MKLTVTIDEADLIRDLVEKESHRCYIMSIKEPSQGMSDFYRLMSEGFFELMSRIDAEIAEERRRSDGQRTLL